MLGKPNKQKDFFDNYVYENLLPSEHILLDIKNKIDFSFVEEETKDLYDNQLGRPSFLPDKTILHQTKIIHQTYRRRANPRDKSFQKDNQRSKG